MLSSFSTSNSSLLCLLVSNYRLQPNDPASIFKKTRKKMSAGEIEQFEHFGQIWKCEDEMCQIIWTHLLASKQKSCKHEEESFSSWCRSSKCCLATFKCFVALYCLAQSTWCPHEPQLCNYKQSGVVPECGLALTTPVSVSAHTLAFVVLRGSHLSSKVLLCGCCSVTCVSVPAGGLESATHLTMEMLWRKNAVCLQPKLVESRKEPAPDLAESRSVL